MASSGHTTARTVSPHNLLDFLFSRNVKRLFNLSHILKRRLSSVARRLVVFFSLCGLLLNVWH